MPLQARRSYCDAAVAEACDCEKLKPTGDIFFKMTPVGFEPTPFRNGALSHRLRPLGQSVVVVDV